MRRQKPHRNMGHSAESEQRQAGDDDRNPMIVIQPPVELMTRQIRRVLGHERVLL